MSNSSTSPCEVCGEPVEVHEDYMGSILCEANGKCSKCNKYAFEYAYGGFIVFIGGREFVWHYSQPNDVQDSVQSQMRAAASKEKELLSPK